MPQHVHAQGATDDQAGDGGDENPRVVGPEGDLEGRQAGDLRQRRQQPLRDRVEENEDPDRRVEDRLDEEGRGDGGIGGAGDLPFDQEDFGDVAGAGGDDGVDPGPGEVGGAELEEADAALRIGGLEDVAPGPGAGQLHRQQAEQGDREGGPPDVREVAEEFRGRVEELVEAGGEIGRRHRS
jgi:hypothetical protein